MELHAAREVQTKDQEIVKRSPFSIHSPASNIQHSTTIHCPSICSFIHPSIHSLCPFIHLPLHVISIYHTLSIHPPTQYPPIHQSYPFNIYSFLYLHIQPSNCPSVYSSVQMSIFSIYPFIQSTDPSFHSSTVYLSIYSSFIHSNSIYLSMLHLAY